MVTGTNYSFNVFDIITGKSKLSICDNNDNLEFEFSNLVKLNETTIGSGESNLFIWNIITGTLYKKIVYQPQYQLNINIKLNNTQIVIGFKTYLTFWDINTGKFFKLVDTKVTDIRNLLKINKFQILCGDYDGYNIIDILDS